MPSGAGGSFHVSLYAPGGLVSHLEEAESQAKCSEQIIGKNSSVHSGAEEKNSEPVIKADKNGGQEHEEP